MLWEEKRLDAILLDRREHLVEPGAGRAAGSERLLDAGDKRALVVVRCAFDHRLHRSRDLVCGGVLEVGVDRAGQAFGQRAAKPRGSDLCEGCA